MDSSQDIQNNCSDDTRNLVQLRHLINKLEGKSDEAEYQKVTVEINSVIESGKDRIKQAKNPESKLKCYESIFASVSAILTGIKDYV